MLEPTSHLYIVAASVRAVLGTGQYRSFRSFIGLSTGSEGLLYDSVLQGALYRVALYNASGSGGAGY